PRRRAAGGQASRWAAPARSWSRSSSLRAAEDPDQLVEVLPARGRAAEGPDAVGEAVHPPLGDERQGVPDRVPGQGLADEVLAVGGVVEEAELLLVAQAGHTLHVGDLEAPHLVALAGPGVAQ